MFNYKGIASDLIFGSETIFMLKKIIDIIYKYFDINDKFPEIKIIIHPDYQKNQNLSPETRKGYILLCTNICNSGKYDFYQQISWQFSHELVHVCKGYKESRKIWKYLPDDDDEEILAGGIAIRIINEFYPEYDYKINYNKTNLELCIKKSESLNIL